MPESIPTALVIIDILFIAIGSLALGSVVGAVHRRRFIKSMPACTQCHYHGTVCAACKPGSSLRSSRL